MKLHTIRNLILVFLPAALVWAAGLILPVAAGAGTTLTIGVGRDFLDGPDSRAYVHGSTHAWEALTYLDNHLKPVPWLAERWEARDRGKTWVFYLRPGVKFHNGALLTADLAKASVQRIASHPRYDPPVPFATWHP